jgi:hypothetical protein
MLFLDACDAVAPIVNLVKHGIIPLIQAVIIIALIVLLIIDLGKAVMAGKEDEIKSAQKLAIKRVVYAVLVFLVPWIVNVAMGLLVNANGAAEDPNGNAVDALRCYFGR